MFTGSVLTHIPLLFCTGVICLVFLSAGSLGYHLLRGLRPHSLTRLEVALFSCALGIGAMVLGCFVLFAVGAGRPEVIVGGILLLSLVLWRTEKHLLRRGLHLVIDSWQVQPVWIRLIVVVMSLQLLACYFRALCPSTHYDDLHYHLMAPLCWMRMGRFHYLPSYLHTNWPMNIETLFGIGLAFDLHFPTAVFECCFGILLLSAVFMFGRSLGGVWIGALAAVLTLRQSWSFLVTSYIDVALAFYTTLAVYAMHRAITEIEGKTQRNWLTLSALLCGFAAGTKLSAVATLVLLPTLLFFFYQPHEAFVLRVREALRYFGIGFAVVCPWYLRCWVHTGDPLYPFLWRLFHPVDWDAAVNIRLKECLRDLVMMPSWNLSSPTVQKLKIGAAGILLPLGIVGAGLRVLRPVRLLILFVVASLLIQVLSIGIYLRYLISVLPTGNIVVAWIGYQTLRRSSWREGGLAIVTILLFILPLGHLRQNGELLRMGLPSALGTVSHDTFLERNLPVYPALREASRVLPADTVLVFGVWYDAYGALIPFRSLQTTVWLQGALRTDDWERFLSDLKRHGATHLIMQDLPVLTPEEIADLRRELQLRAQIEFPNLYRLRDTYGTPVFSRGGFTVYSLHLP